MPVQPHVQLDEESKLPAYVQIRNQLRDRILHGDLPAGTRLPPERALAQSLGVSRTTVVSAYDELEADGLVKPSMRSPTNWPRSIA